MTEAGIQFDPPGAYFAPQPFITVMGVEYLHLRLEDGSDLYFTEHGRAFTSHLMPANHCEDDDWLARHAVRLPGTSTLFRIATKQVHGQSIEIVLKWNRMGQDIPGETAATDLGNAAFNSPFEEFSLVGELRNARRDGAFGLLTHRPLAIYVPRRFVHAEQMGRRSYRIEAIQEKHTEILLDPNRQYAVMYEWIKGIDTAEALREGLIDEEMMRSLVARSSRKMARRGFRVLDSKPHHIIVRPRPDGGIARDRSGKVLYAMVDFELLERTPQHESATRASKRRSYLVRQARRFQAGERVPPGLQAVTIMGVDYVFGQVESTGGALWVVGRDPALFEYFLPEKWRKTPRANLSDLHRTYHTQTKDDIHLVWRVSQVGVPPSTDPRTANARRIAAYGYNSPFEEIALAMELAAEGIETTSPRAIYMTRARDVAPEKIDTRRYRGHQRFRMPDGHPILCEHHDYMTIWGYWNGPDEKLAVKDEQICEGIDSLRALGQNLLGQNVYREMMAAVSGRLAAVGIEDLNPTGRHLLLSLDRSGRLVLEPTGLPAVRICTFELLRHAR